MVRPRKIPKNFVPVEWTDTDEDDVFQDDEVEIQVEEGDDLASDNEHDNEVDVQNPVENLQNPVENQPGNDGEEDDMDSDPELDQEFNSVEEPFQILAKKWLLIEMSHCVSKRASDKFWKAATTFFNPGTKIPSFTHLRRQLLKKNCPNVSIDLAYKNAESGIISRESDVNVISNSQFRKPEFEPQYEIATVKVIIYFLLINLLFIGP